MSCFIVSHQSNLDKPTMTHTNAAIYIPFLLFCADFAASRLQPLSIEEKRRDNKRSEKRSKSGEMRREEKRREEERLYDNEMPSHYLYENVLEGRDMT